jgi:hypothetical protein
VAEYEQQANDESNGKSLIGLWIVILFTVARLLGMF